MKICKNKGKTTIVASRQGNMWHLRNGGDGEANTSKAGMTKGGKQWPMASRAKPAPETEATCARRLWPPRQGRRRSAARQPCNSRCRQPQPLQPSNVGGPLTSTHRRLAPHWVPCGSRVATSCREKTTDVQDITSLHTTP